jgi:hypothetical protein
MQAYQHQCTVTQAMSSVGIGRIAICNNIKIGKRVTNKIAYVNKYERYALLENQKTTTTKQNQSE